MNNGELIRIDEGYYIYKFYNQEKRVSFTYAYDMACKLCDELARLGIAVKTPQPHNIGLEAGFDDYKAIKDDCELYSVINGYKFVSLLHPQFRGFEGCKVKAIKSGETKVSTFWVDTWGNYAPYHIAKRKKEHKHGGKRLTGNYTLVQRVEIEGVQK